MNEPNTYWDACVCCLPPEKRAAAERAYQEIESGGPDGMFPKVLLLLEAHAAYTNTIPARIVEAGDQAAARVREAAEAHPENSGKSKEELEQLLAAVRAGDGGESARAMKTQLEDVGREVKKLNGQVSRLRNLRVGAALFLVCTAALCSGVGVYSYMHGTNGGLLVNMHREGFGLKVFPKENKLDVLLEGPVEKAVLINMNGTTNVAAEVSGQ